MIDGPMDGLGDLLGFAGLVTFAIALYLLAGVMP